MQYFAKKRRFDGVVRKFEGKMIKVKQGKESARKRAVIVTCDIPITKKMKEHLPARVLAFLGQGETLPGEPAYHKMELDWEMMCLLNIYSAGNNSGKHPLVSKGADNDDRVRLQVKKFFFVEEVEYMQVKLTMFKDVAVWTWGGEIFGDGEANFEVKPLQGELAFDGDEDADEDADEDEKPGKE